MDKSQYVDKRRRKYLAQLMEAFEELIEPQTTNPESVATYKGLVRAKMNALSVDAIDVMCLRENEAINGYAIDTTDRLFPNGRPHSGSRGAET
jgi:hypothetical protein